MGFFLLFLVWAAFFVVGELIRPKPELENARPLGLGDFNFPTATEGRAVPIVWGRVMIKGPNCTWYGNLRNVPITKNVKTGLFSSEDIITGFRYYLGLQLAICRGPVDQLHVIRINDKHASNGRIGDGTVVISAGNIFGGEEHGSGGISGTGSFYTGSKTQAVNSYLSSKTGGAIAYRGTCYYVFEGGYMGTAPSVPPWHFEVSRIPDGLGMASYDPGSETVNTWDCNPMNVIYEIMTDTDWGLHIPIADIDLASFRAAGSVLADEDNGFSMVLDSERQASDLIEEVTRQIDGALYFDREAGLWKMQLARDDYTPSTLDVFDEDNIIELIDYGRTTWQETTNQVRVSYLDRDDSYKQTYAMAQDMANVILQGGSVSVEVSFPGVKNAALANQLAWRELRTLAYPLAKVNFKVNRTAFDLTPGEVFKLSWIRLGISEIVFRVARIDYGNIEDGTITIYAIQDIFAAGTGVFADPPGTGWTQPADAAVAPDTDETLTFEAPGQMVAADPDNPTLNPRIWMGARDPGGGTINFKSYSQFAVNPASLTTNEVDFIEDQVVNSFLMIGTVETAIDQYGSSAVRPATDYTIRINDDDPDALADLAVTGNASLVESMINIIRINDEFIGFETMADAGGNVYQLTSIYRGLFNSAPQAHAVDDEVWFIGQSGGGLTLRVVPTNYTGAAIQLRGQDKIPDETTFAGTPIETLPAITNTWSEPLPPRDPKLHGSYAPSSGTLDTLYTTETGLTGDDARALEVEVTPRSWRINQILQDTIFNEDDYLADNPEFDFKLTLDPGGTPVDTEEFNVDSTATPTAYILRNAVIVAVGANASIPTTGRIVVSAVHWPSGFSQQTAVNDMEFDFTVSSALQSADDLTFGGLTKDVASDVVIFGETGTYTFDIHTALPSSGIVEIKVGAAAWATLIGSGATSNTIALTIGDNIQLRFDQYPADDQFFDIVGPTAELGYGVLKAL